MKQQYWAVVTPMIGVFVLLLDCCPVLLPLWIVMKTENLLLQVAQDDVYASVKRTQFPTRVSFHLYSKIDLPGSHVEVQKIRQKCRR